MERLRYIQKRRVRYKNAKSRCKHENKENKEENKE